MLLWIVLGIVAAVFLFFVLLGYGCFRVACVRRSHYPSDTTEHGKSGLPPILADARRWYDAVPSESVSIRSFDGLRLVGRWIPAEQAPKGVVLLFHGYHSSPRRDFALHAQILHEQGYHLLLPFQRSHGESEGKYICFGSKERHDVESWCRFVTQKVGQELPLSLFGISMGAASVMMAADRPLVPSVRCIVADCGFTEPFQIIRRRLLRKHKIFPYPTIFFMNFWSRLLADFNFRGISSAETVRQSTLPLLLIHGDADRYVPLAMTKEIFAARPQNTRLLVIPNAPHARALVTDPTTYREAVLQFLATHMSKK